jgi:hypothetical protein
MASVFEMLGLFGIYSGRIPWRDLKGSTMPDSGERPYTLAKTFILMYSKELARRLQGSGVDVFAGKSDLVSDRRGVQVGRCCGLKRGGGKGGLLGW